jgi:hypothetical protein
MGIFIRTDLDLDALAAKIREVFNLRDRNRSAYQLDQDREGLNYGGPYYLFEALGLELYLLRNEGEVEDPEHAECGFYLYVELGIPDDKETRKRLTVHLDRVL